MSGTERNIRVRFSGNLRAWRKHMGMSQEVMAAGLGVKRSTYAGWEGCASEPSLQHLHTIQQRFKIGADVLLLAELEGLRPSQWHQVLGGAGAPRALEGITMYRTA